MDIATISKLIDAGYTKEEITALEQLKDAPEETPEQPEEPAKDTPKDAPEKAAPEKAQDNGILEAISQLTGTVTALQETVKAMQNANIKDAKSDKKSKETVDDVLKSFTETL